MADKIKKFFAKKKVDAKFKIAGPGRKLTNDSSGVVVGPSKAKHKHQGQAVRSEPSQAGRHAAEAALARLNNQQSKSTNFNTSLAAIQAQVKRELEAERKEAASNNSPTSTRKVVETELESSPMLAVTGVYFRCPMVSEEVLSKNDWKIKIKEFLMEQLEEERGLTACLMIHSCNYNRTKVSECVEILCKYLDNIIAHPEETKFHRIRCSNATFSDKVIPILGATDLLLAAGFQQKQIESNGTVEDFWIFDAENVDGISTLEFLRDAIKSEDRIELELDRNIQVLFPAEAAKRVELPQDFYALSPEELKKEQQLRAEVMEKQMQLRTKAMREKDEIREIRKYKFALIRIRFPDGLYLQSTFSVYEKFSEVLELVQENLEYTSSSFTLLSPTGHKFEPADKEKTLFDLRLVPATILAFHWKEAVPDDVASTFLKPEVMMLVRAL